MNILVVEDNLYLRKTLWELLSGFGHEVVVASDIQEAKLFLETNGVDLLLTDLNIGPELGGRILIQFVKQHKVHRVSRVKTILMSGLPASTLKDEATIAGADGFLEEFMIGGLKQLIEEVMR